MTAVFNEVLGNSFEYGALDAETATEARAAADRIRKILKYTTAGLIEAGQRLMAIKNRLPHGQFIAWVSAEFGMSDRTARLYMRAAEFAAGKTETVSVLQPTTIYALAAPSTPDRVKMGVVQRLENGEAVTDREVKQLINSARQETKEVAERHVPADGKSNLTGFAEAEAGKDIWGVERLTAEHTLTSQYTEAENSLAAVMHAFEMLSTDDRATFDRWYRQAYQIDLNADTITENALPGNGTAQLILPLEYRPERNGSENECPTDI